MPDVRHVRAHISCGCSQQHNLNTVQFACHTHLLLGVSGGVATADLRVAPEHGLVDAHLVHHAHGWLLQAVGNVEAPGGRGGKFMKRTAWLAMCLQKLTAVLRCNSMS